MRFGRLVNVTWTLPIFLKKFRISLERNGLALIEIGSVAPQLSVKRIIKAVFQFKLIQYLFYMVLTFNIFQKKMLYLSTTENLVKLNWRFPTEVV